jgi:hypothetical protein
MNKNKKALNGFSSVYLTVGRELMVGENQYKDNHELRPGAFFVKIA